MMYSWMWSLRCMFGFHRWCPARWDVAGGRATCNCDRRDKRHNHEHTNTFSADWKG